MKQFVATLALVAFPALSLVGCGSNTYAPKAQPTELSSYAGKAEYPSQMHAEEATHIFCMVAPDATITLYNAGEESLVGFELWVNKMYTLHVDKLDARSMLPIAPNTLYNKTGISMDGMAANTIGTVQIRTGDHLLDVQGPIMPVAH